MPTVFAKEVMILPDYEVVRAIEQNKGAYVPWIGAGISVEAGVKTGNQICDDIRRELASYHKPPDEPEWADAYLNWQDPRRRYSTCLSRLGPPAHRVKYFRELIKGLQPSFNHHATALLMDAGHLSKSCLTTNFDKLLEIAFAQQGISEFQAIRSDEEAMFWRQEPDKCYAVKLHGDYDTHNIRNTSEETISIPDQLLNVGLDILGQKGLVVLGSSGYETSVISFLSAAARDKNKTTLNMGLFWGVYLGRQKPGGLTAREEELLLIDKLKTGAVSKESVDLISANNSRDRFFAFFPVWGAGNFLNQIIERSGNKFLSGRASRYLDHEMRLHYVFSKNGLDSNAIENRLKRLRSRAEIERQTSAQYSRRSERFARVGVASRDPGPCTVELVNGDITSRSLMASDRFPSGVRAVVSPEDIFLSAGGGVALGLLQKAGKYTLLNEMAKFQSVGHRDVIVTSAGDLPVNYVFHAAATELDKNGNSNTTPDDVGAVVRSAFEKAYSLNVRVLFLPLIASGVEGMDPRVSLETILLSIAKWSNSDTDFPIHANIVIRQEERLSEAEAWASMQHALQPAFQVVKYSAPASQT